MSVFGFSSSDDCISGGKSKFTAYDNISFVTNIKKKCNVKTQIPPRPIQLCRILYSESYINLARFGLNRHEQTPSRICINFF